MPGIKGQHRKMFRKPGLARQAIGILASSPELAQEVQNPAPQPVQKFNTGGLAQLIGYNPGFDAQGQAIPGFGGFYQRISGIENPERARSMRNLDLIRLGLSIAGGQSDDTATNVIQGLTGTLNQISARRPQELAVAMKAAELGAAQTAIKKKDMQETLKPFREAVAAAGGSIDMGTGEVTMDGNKFANIEQFNKYLNKQDSDGSYVNAAKRELFQGTLVKVARPTDRERALKALYDPEIPLSQAISAAKLQLGADSDAQKALRQEAIKAAIARNLVLIDKNGDQLTEIPTTTSAMKELRFSDKQGNVFNIEGIKVN